MEKEDLYEAALDRLKKQYEGGNSVADINAAMAQHYFTKGMGYQVPAFGEQDFDDRKWLLKKAHDLCHETIKAYPKTVAATTCYGLLTQILHKDMALEAEMVNLPKQPFLAKLTYRNLKKVHLKTIPFDQSKREAFEKLRNERNWKKKAIDFLNDCKAINTWSVNLPDEGDFHRHSTELKIDALPLGQYAIIISENENFEGEGAVGYLFINVSNIGYWERKGDGDGSEFVIFNRNGGGPIKGATVEFWVQNYNSVFRKYEKKKKAVKTSDADGFVKSDLRNREDRNFSIRVKHAGDELITDRNFYNNFYRNNARPYQQTQFFLDRAIYRPGQTVYFKGIALNFDTERMPTILKNEKVTVTYRDANYQEAAKLDLQTNEYGTFSGQFVTPRGGLLGNMQIVSSIGGNSKSFRVEEYKRPKFEVTFEPIKESYRINSEVTVNGNAKAYAGNQIDGAQVTWRVVRETRFPWYWWGWGRMPWGGETMEIAHGTTVTDENGQFNIDFKAIPDKKIPAENKPEFNYTIYADVTDITGETQSNQTYIKVGYISMTLDVPIAQQMNVDSLQKLKLVTKNLNGEFEPAKGTINLEMLKAPNQIYIDRYWGATDKRIIPEAEFKKEFPQFAWNNENKPGSWAAAKTVLSENFDTEKAQEVSLPKSKLEPGWYAITINTKDKYGEKVELKKYFSTFDLNKNELPAPTLSWHFLENKKYEPGSSANSHFASSKKQQPVLIEYEKDGETLERKWLRVNDLTSKVFSINESHRGNVSYLFSYAGMNRSFNLAQTINVPWSNKELTIEYGTFRDKLQPGQDEEWVIKVKGPKGEKVAAEMVAGMYDASLDAFATNHWGMSVFPMSYSRVRYSGSTFTTVNHNLISYFQNTVSNPHASMGRRYDRLNWFNWYFHAYGGGVLKSTHRMAMSAAPVEMEHVEMAMDEVQVRAERDGATDYYVDGLKVNGNSLANAKKMLKLTVWKQMRKLPILLPCRSEPT